MEGSGYIIISNKLRYCADTTGLSTCRPFTGKQGRNNATSHTWYDFFDTRSAKGDYLECAGMNSRSWSAVLLRLRPVCLSVS